MRKKDGFNVGRFDIDVGKDHGRPGAHDFLAPAGFLSEA